MLPALEGGFFTTGPPGKSLKYIFKNIFHIFLYLVGSLLFLCQSVILSIMDSGVLKYPTIIFIYFYFVLFIYFYLFFGHMAQLVGS